MNKATKTKEKPRRLSKERGDYMELYLKYNENIPENFLTVVLKKHPDWNANRINNVRYGRTVDVEMFKEIIKLSCK